MHRTHASKAAALACIVGLSLAPATPVAQALASSGDTGLYLRGSDDTDDIVTPLGEDPDDPDGSSDNLRVTIPVAIHYVANLDGSLVGPSNGSVRISNNCNMNVHVSSIQVEDNASVPATIESEPGVDQVQINLTPKTYLDHEGTAHMGETINLADFKNAPYSTVPGDWNILRSDADISADATARAKDTENKLELFGGEGSTTLDGHIDGFDQLDPTREQQFGTIHWTVQPGTAVRSARLANGETLNARIASVAGGAENVKAVEFRCNTPASDESLSLSDELGLKVGVTYDAESGCVFIDTEANTLFLPQDLTGMWDGFDKLESVKLDKGSSTLLDYPDVLNTLPDPTGVTCPGKTRRTVSFEPAEGNTASAMEPVSVLSGLGVVLPQSTYTYGGPISFGWQLGEVVMQPGTLYVPREDTTFTEVTGTVVAAPLHNTLAEYSEEDLSLASRHIEQVAAIGNRTLLEEDEVYSAFAGFLENGETWSSSESAQYIACDPQSRNVITAQLVDILHDEKADGSGKVGLSFICFPMRLTSPAKIDHYYMQGQGADTAHNVGGWEQAQLRNNTLATTDDSMYRNFPTKLKNIVVPVKKLTNNTGFTRTPESVTATNDLFWIPSLKEVFGNSDFFEGKAGYDEQTAAVLNAEGTQYAYFRDVLNVQLGASGYYTPASTLTSLFYTEKALLRSPWPATEPSNSAWICISGESSQPKPVLAMGNLSATYNVGFCV